MFRIFLCLFSFQAFAQNASDLKQDAMKNFQQFNPSGAIPHYNPHPTEESIHPENQDDFGYLESLGHNRLSKDDEARFVYENEAHRIKVAENEKDSLLKNAEQLIEHAEENIYQQCHDEPVPCDEKKTQQICHERAVYESFSCPKRLNVVLEKKAHVPVKRMLVAGLVYDLSRCLESSKEPYCRPETLIQLGSNCQYLNIKITSLSGHEYPIGKYPNCKDTTFSISGKGRMIVQINAQEAYEKESWNQSVCDFKNQYFCTPKAEEHCIEGPQTKTIDGIHISRDCWAKTEDFDCAVGSQSDCTPWQDKGCANISAICQSLRNDGRCDEIERTYQCIERTCYPDKRVCTEALPCVDGSCDQTQNEESDDIQEGISRLGAVAGSAEEVSQQKNLSGSVEIFKGSRQACSSLPLGARDCCEGEGFLEGVFHCPANLQELQRAKLENRAVLVGTYKEDLNLKKIFVYCVFPTKLAGILQIQGRLGQLGIGFGEPKNPLCDSGFKASLLERIDFKRLDLSSIVNDFKAKAQFKRLEEVENDAKNQAQDLHDKGKAHD